MGELVKPSLKKMYIYEGSVSKGREQTPPQKRHGTIVLFPAKADNIGSVQSSDF